MPAARINFLSKRRKRLSKQQREDRVYLKWARWTLLGVAVVSFGVVGARYGVQEGLLAQTQQDIDRVESRILSQRDLQREFLILVDKVSALQEVIEERSSKQDAIEFFSNLFGTDILIKQISYDPGLQLLRLRVESANVFALEDTFDRLESEEVRSRYPAVAQSDLQRKEDGTYEMDVTIDLTASADESGGSAGTGGAVGGAS